MQVRTLELFLALSRERRTWAGSMLLGTGLNETGRALALASLAAGAAGLFLEPDRAELRLAQRQGCCSFSVTTLEEAIRGLKNELRLGRAVTIALSGDSSALLAEIVGRGLQPQAIAFPRQPQSNEASCCNTLVSRGSQVLHGLGLSAWTGGRDLQTALDHTTGNAWHIETDLAITLSHRRERDRALADSLAADAPQGSVSGTAERWLRVAPSLFPRALDRAYLRYGT